MRAESSQGEMSTDPIDLHIKLVIFHAKKNASVDWRYKPMLNIFLGFLNGLI